jgi:hypothetical protein
VAALTALGSMLAFATMADATCYYSTASSQSYADSPIDAEFGLAPEITSVRANTDVACGLSVEPVIANAYGGDLIDGEAVGVYLDTDGNPSTGSPLWHGADRVVITVGRTGTDLGPGVGTWNGTTFDFASGAILARVGAGGWFANIDQLGIASPVNLGIKTGAIYSGIYDVYGDLAPERGASPFVFPVSFSTVAPPPPPPPPPPPAPPALPPPTTPSSPIRIPNSEANDDPAECEVPRVAGRTLASAKRSLRKAGCEYRVKRQYSGVKAGNVIGTSPGAGRTTTRAVTVRVSRGRRPRTLGKLAIDQLGAIERALSAQQEAHNP